MKEWILLRPKYPIMFKLVTNALSIFQGPLVESTFNVMGYVIDKHSGQLNMETCIESQTTMSGKSLNKRVLQKRETLLSTLNSSLLSNMRKAASLYKQEKKKNRDIQKSRQEDFSVSFDAPRKKRLKLIDEVEPDISVEKHKDT